MVFDYKLKFLFLFGFLFIGLMGFGFAQTPILHSNESVIIQVGADYQETLTLVANISDTTCKLFTSNIATKTYLCGGNIKYYTAKNGSWLTNSDLRIYTYYYPKKLVVADNTKIISETNDVSRYEEGFNINRDAATDSDVHDTGFTFFNLGWKKTQQPRIGELILQLKGFEELTFGNQTDVKIPVQTPTEINEPVKAVAPVTNAPYVSPSGNCNDLKDFFEIEDVKDNPLLVCCSETQGKIYTLNLGATNVAAKESGTFVDFPNYNKMLEKSNTFVDLLLSTGTTGRMKYDSYYKIKNICSWADSRDKPVTQLSNLCNGFTKTWNGVWMYECSSKDNTILLCDPKNGNIITYNSARLDAKQERIIYTTTDSRIVGVKETSENFQQYKETFKICNWKTNLLPTTQQNAVITETTPINIMPPGTTITDSKFVPLGTFSGANWHFVSGTNSKYNSFTTRPIDGINDVVDLVNIYKNNKLSLNVTCSYDNGEKKEFEFLSIFVSETAWDDDSYILIQWGEELKSIGLVKNTNAINLQSKLLDNSVLYSNAYISGDAAGFIIDDSKSLVKFKYFLGGRSLGFFQKNYLKLDDSFTVNQNAIDAIINYCKTGTTTTGNKTKTCDKIQDNEDGYNCSGKEYDIKDSSYYTEGNGVYNCSSGYISYNDSKAKGCIKIDDKEKTSDTGKQDSETKNELNNSPLRQGMTPEQKTSWTNFFQKLYDGIFNRTTSLTSPTSTVCASFKTFSFDSDWAYACDGETKVTPCALKDLTVGKTSYKADQKKDSVDILKFTDPAKTEFTNFCKKKP